MSPSNLFPIKFWKFLAISFGWGCYDSKLLKIFISYLLKSVNYRSEVKSHQMYPKMLRQFSKGSLISISSESSKVHLLIKVLYRHIWFNLCRRYLLFHTLNVSLVLLASVQLYVLAIRPLDTKYFSCAIVITRV